MEDGSWGFPRKSILSLLWTLEVTSSRGGEDLAKDDEHRHTLLSIRRKEGYLRLLLVPALLYYRRGINGATSQWRMASTDDPAPSCTTLQVIRHLSLNELLNISPVLAVNMVQQTAIAPWDSDNVLWPRTQDHVHPPPRTTPSGSLSPSLLALRPEDYPWRLRPTQCLYSQWKLSQSSRF